MVRLWWGMARLKEETREFQYCSVSIMAWSVEHRVIIVRQFFKNGEIWCAVSPTTIIGPYFLQEDAAQTTTVNENRYVDLLTNFFFPELCRRRVSLRRTWFQQDGATSHTARISMEVLRQKFPGRSISRFGDIPWPLRSSDLTSCDFFLWRYPKSKVYINKPRTLHELREEIRRAMRELSRRIWRTQTALSGSAWNSVLRRKGVI